MKSNKLSIIFSVFLLFLLCTELSFGNNEPHGTGFLLTNGSGRMLISKNRSVPMIPASILKIVTSSAAISCLGEDFRYKTCFYFDGSNRDLYVKGFGDPFFISEEIEKACIELAVKLKREKISSVKNIILDNSYFYNTINIPGRSNTLNPYDAYQGALCANFNTIFFKTDKLTGKIISAEEQTPLLPVFKKKLMASGLKKGRIILSEQESIVYPGLLIQYFLKKNKININGRVFPGIRKKGVSLLLVYKSQHRLNNIIQSLLQYSNNFIANQLLLTMGAKVLGAPSNLEKSVAVVNDYLAKNFHDMDINYVEGSGISRRNRISCDNMIRVLICFMPRHNLLRQDGMDFYKTGTLFGIKTRAGYIQGSNGSLYPYVIMINQKNKGYNNILKRMKNLIENQ